MGSVPIYHAAVSQPPYRAQPIGSFLRPREVPEGRNVDEHIVRLIRWQEELGLEVVTDGEFRRESWRLGLVSKVAGFAQAEAFGNVDLQRDEAGNVMKIGSAPGAVTRIRRVRPIVTHQARFPLAPTKPTGKGTMPPPSDLDHPLGKRWVHPAAYPD